MMPAFAVAAENRQSGIRLLSVADAARPGGAREVPPAQFWFDCTVTRSATLSAFCALISLYPNVFAVLGGITLDFATDS